MAKTFFLDQHGCAKNQVDGEIILTRLVNAGYVQTMEPAEADLIIINSCGFIESAKKESLDSLMDARSAFPKAKILLAGCLAERYAEVFKNELPEADGIFGNGDLTKIDTVVQDLFNGNHPVVKPEQKGVCCGERTNLLNYSGSAFVKITEGCNNRCSFCAIPLIRGELRSRKASEIVAEIKQLIANGIHEINLIGQDLAAYGCGKDDDVFDNGDNWYNIIYKELKQPLFKIENFNGGKKSPLRLLMEEIQKLEGKFWVRLLYIHPDHFNPDILEIIKQDKRFLPYFDIPFQSGDTTIIHQMNRKGSFESYAELIKLIRKELGDSCIRTTFLTGFPGEDEKMAQNTVEFLKEIQSDWSGCFPYSTEDDTPAAAFKKKVPNKKAVARAGVLESIQAQITADRLNARVGKEYEVLVEEVVENQNGTDEGLAIGRAWFDAPEVDGSFVIVYDLDNPDAVKNIVPGNLVKVKAYASSATDIEGEYIPL